MYPLSVAARNLNHFHGFAPSSSAAIGSSTSTGAGCLLPLSVSVCRSSIPAVGWRTSTVAACSAVGWCISAIVGCALKGCGSTGLGMLIAASMASQIARLTATLSRKRTSRFVGCTFTSTCDGGRSMKRKSAGFASPWWRGYASRTAYAIDGALAGRPLTKTYCSWRVGAERFGRSM